VGDNGRKRLIVEQSEASQSLIPAGHWWLTPVIPATWAEVRRIMIPGQPKQIVQGPTPPIFKNNQSKMDWR
jgi:hypothetical protein